jgi:hypothetical protein
MGVGDVIAQGRLPRFIPLPAVTIPTTALARGAESPSYLSMRTIRAGTGVTPAWELGRFLAV